MLAESSSEEFKTEDKVPKSMPARSYESKTPPFAMSRKEVSHEPLPYLRKNCGKKRFTAMNILKVRIDGALIRL